MKRLYSNNLDIGTVLYKKHSISLFGIVLTCSWLEYIFITLTSKKIIKIFKKNKKMKALK